jgi:hypothetical protein
MEEKKEIEIQPSSGVKLTKKGLPDKRSITSKQNINKAQKKVKEVLQSEGKKIVEKAKVVREEIESEYETEEDSDTEYTIQKVSSKSKVKSKPAIVIEEPKPENDVAEKINILTKSFEDLKLENQNLKKTFIQADHLHKINSMTRKMLLKF